MVRLHKIGEKWREYCITFVDCSGRNDGTLFGVSFAHGEIFSDLIKSNRNLIVVTIYQLIWNQTEVKFLFKVNLKIVNTIWFLFDLIRFGKYFSVCTTIQMINIVFHTHTRRLNAMGGKQGTKLSSYETSWKERILRPQCIHYATFRSTFWRNETQ